MNNETEQIFLVNPPVNPSSSEVLKLSEEPTAAQVNLEDVSDFNSVCRICATVTQDVVPIFEGEGVHNNLAEKINKHLPIEVTLGDGLPGALCVQCAHTVLAWHEMVVCCAHADRALRTRRAQIEQRRTQEQKLIENEECQSIEHKQNEEKTRNVSQLGAREDDVRESELANTKCIDKPSIVTIREDGKKYASCEVCNKNVSLSSWRRHVRSHCGDKRYSCHACGLSFTDNGNLARHSRAVHARHRPHVCPTCNKTFTRNGHLEDHMRSHSESRDFVCYVCGKASKSSAALRSHRKIHEMECKFQCMECRAMFKRTGQLKAHVSVHTGERAHTCGCGRAFRLRSQLTTHQSRAHTDHAPVTQHSLSIQGNSSMYKTQLRLLPHPELAPPAPAPPALRTCEYCTDHVPEAAYDEHLIDAHADCVFYCDNCNSYVDRKNFILHMSLHAVEYSADSDQRADTAHNEATIDARDKHVEIKIEAIKNNLDNIEEQRISNGILEDFVKENDFSDHSDNEDGFGPLPESVFEAIEDTQDSDSGDDTSPSDRAGAVDNQASPSPPERVPEPEPVDDKSKEKKHKRPRKCPICEKVYNASSSYFYHMRYHHKGTKDHECDTCGRKFGTRANLAQHYTIHTGECQYECKECSKRFRSFAGLYIHTQTHKGVKTFNCSQCDVSFRWRTHLQRHMKRHETEKAHKCPTCGRGFSVKCDLLRHVRTHTAGEYSCDKCGVKLSQLRYLKSHMHKKHSPDIKKGSQRPT